MRSTLILTLAMAGLSFAQISSYNTVLEGQTFAAVISVKDGKTATYLAYTTTITIPTFAASETPKTVTITHTYPPGYIEEQVSLNSVVTADPAYTSILSVEAHATGVAGSAVTAYSSLLAAYTGPNAFTDPDVARSYFQTLSAIYTQLPTEVQSYQNSLKDRYSSIWSKYDIFNYTIPTELEWRTTTSASITASFTDDSPSTTSTFAAVSTGGVERLAVGVAGYLAAAGAAGLGVAAVLL